ncbi:uncharacterized protein [Setaria viridis]|uniref:uncharacterized protein n=1 Tax=Setaria viridis TaxID=4556 RepID=UPI003B3A83F0
MNISLRDCIRKRREEEDDDMMMFLFPALYLMGSAREGGVKKKRHISKEIGEVKVCRLLEGHIKNCQVTFRMEPHIFKELATYLRRKRLIVDTRITVEEKLGFFLYMLSRNASYEDLAVTFGHSNDTFHYHINHFFKKVIPIFSHCFLQSPDPNQVYPKIQDNPRFYPFFKNCLGAIDGTHILVSTFLEKHSPFRNRTGTLSINVMVACDFDLNITLSLLLNVVGQRGVEVHHETFLKIKKFQNNKASFSLFDALGELYDGHLAEGTYNFTSIESQRVEEPLHQIDDVEDGA